MTSVPVYQWQPTTPEIARRAGIRPDEVVRFDQNTSPAAPPWVAEEAAAHAGGIHDYPGADYRPLREAIASYRGVDPAQIVVGAGADELILIVAKAFLGPGRVAATDTPAYPMYRIATLQLGATFEEVPRDPETLAFPTRDLARAAAAADVTWLCAPHNPVGDTPPVDAVREVAADAAGVVVVDAAYAEFTGDRWDELLDGGAIVLGTMSKAFGLAGARVGYAVAPPALAPRLDAMRPPGSISSTSAALAIRGLDDPGWMRANVASLSREREALGARLSGLGIRVRPTLTNFVVGEVGPGARDTAARLMDGFGLVVRSFPDGHPFASFLRFTVRTPADHDRLIDALEQTL
jgi:histidinol-phosphate aminotransferase